MKEVANELRPKEQTQCGSCAMEGIVVEEQICRSFLRKYDCSLPFNIENGQVHP